MPDESYFCTVCGEIQAHDCNYVHYECSICGGAYPWEEDIIYFDGKFGRIQGVYYAQTELNIYKYPDTESEVVGTLGVNEGIYCVGSFYSEDSSDDTTFWITEDGRCIPIGAVVNSNRNNLRIAKTNQVVVTYMTLSGNTYSVSKLHAVYDSYDAALLDLCGTSWSTIKANWTYNDYKSQGLPFMNSFSEGASGKTVSTRNKIDPDSYSKGDGTVYYFE